MSISKSTLLLLSAICANTVLVNAVNSNEAFATPIEETEAQPSDIALALETLPTVETDSEIAPAFALEFQTEELLAEVSAEIEITDSEAIDSEAIVTVETTSEQTVEATSDRIPTTSVTELTPEETAASSFETLIPNAPVVAPPVATESPYLLSNELGGELIDEIEYETLAQFEEPAANGTPKFGQAGKQRWYVQGAVAADLDDDLFGLLGAGITHFVYDYHSLSLELNGLAFSQPGDDAVGLNLALLLRSHWIRGENWTIYVDGGAGIIVTTNEVPAVGSSFNFTPQIGGGATFDIGNNNRIMTGLRWHHISNANLYESNPGLDVWFGYVGINFPL